MTQNCCGSPAGCPHHPLLALDTDAAETLSALVAQTASPGAVRTTLRRARDILWSRGLGRDMLDTCELVLAEALNNVVEHALAGLPEGRFWLWLGASNAQVVAEICDEGRAMAGQKVLTDLKRTGGPDRSNGAEAGRSGLRGLRPAGSTLPTGRGPATPPEDLPEGGFGWDLICRLCSDVRYRRSEGLNRLCLTLPREGDDSAAPPHPAGMMRRRPSAPKLPSFRQS